jgi:Flp pilus assembly protein TadB
MAIWYELGIFALALAFGWWQLHDVKKARAQTRAKREAEARRAAAEAVLTGDTKPAGSPNPSPAAGEPDRQ